MRSFTSSSNAGERLPPGPWGRTWLVALAICFVVLFGLETFWRSRGFQPSVNDDVQLWSVARRQVRRGDREQMVLIGDSRIQLGINTDVLATACGGRRAVQLAVDGSSCLPLLKHFSEDETFCGILVCSLNEGLFAGKLEFESGEQAEYLRYFQSQNASSDLEHRLRMLLQRSFALLLPDVGIANVRNSLRKHSHLPKPGFITVLSDRCKLADYQRAALNFDRHAKKHSVAQGKRSSASPIPSDQMRTNVATIAKLVQRIEHRGGRVVFVRFPLSGSRLVSREQSLPRAAEWDYLVAQTGAIAIHYADHPALSGYVCPDERHLDYRDAIPYTRSLAEIMLRELRTREQLAAGDARHVD